MFCALHINFVLCVYVYLDIICECRESHGLGLELKMLNKTSAYLSSLMQPVWTLKSDNPEQR